MAFVDEQTKKTFYHQATTNTSAWDFPVDAVLEDSESGSEPDIPPVQDATMELWQTKNFYGQLGVSGSATFQDITKAYRKLARSCHPDKCIETQERQATEYLKMVIDAYKVLKD